MLSPVVPVHSLPVFLTIVVLTVTLCVMKSGTVNEERMRLIVVSEFTIIMLPAKRDHCNWLQVSMNVISQMATIVHTFVKTTFLHTSAAVQLA